MSQYYLHPPTKLNLPKAYIENIKLKLKYLVNFKDKIEINTEYSVTFTEMFERLEKGLYHKD